MMSLTEPETQALGCIADGLAGSDPRLASMLTIFSRLAAGEEMPAREKTRVRRGRPAVLRPRRARRHPRRGTAFPQPRRRYPPLGWQQAMLVLGGRRLRRTAHRRAGPHRQRPHDLRPADGNGVPLALYPAAGRRGRPLCVVKMTLNPRSKCVHIEGGYIRVQEDASHLAIGSAMGASGCMNQPVA